MRVVAALSVMTLLLGAARARAQTVLPNQGNVRLEAADLNQPSCSGCARPTGIHITSYRVTVRAPDAWQIETVEAPAGAVRDLAISPNGRRAEARVVASGRGARNAPVVVTLVDVRAAARATITETYEDYDARETLRCEQAPCSDAVPEAQRLGADDGDDGAAAGVLLGRELVLERVRFMGEWPARFSAIVTTRRGAPLVGGEASVACPRVTARVTTRPTGAPSFTFSARASGPRMVAGVHTCTLRVDPGSGGRRLAGVLRIRIDAGGDLSILSPRVRVAPPARRRPGAATPAASPRAL